MASPLIPKDKREFVRDIQDKFAKGAKWAAMAYEFEGRYFISVTDGINRYEMIGALEDLKHDLICGDDTDDA